MYDIYQTKSFVKVFLSYLRAAQQFNGREGETAIFLFSFFFHINLCGGGFAPRHLSRSQLQTTMKHYTSTDAGMIQEMNARMNNFNSQREVKAPKENDFVN